MKNALIAAVVAAVVAAASGTAATIVVTSKEIKNGTIQTVDISANAKRALKGNRGPRGFNGAPGVQGATGATGAQGPPGIQTLTKVNAWTDVPPLSYRSVTATCPAGQKAISGGVAFPGEVWENQQKLTIGDGWIGTGFNLSDTDTYTVYVTALCSANVSVTGAGLTALSEAQKAAFADAAEARLDGK